MKLACMDLDPSSDCDFVATGKTAKEVANSMMYHMKKSHPDKVSEMKMDDDEIMTMLESKVHE